MRNKIIFLGTRTPQIVNIIGEVAGDSVPGSAPNVGDAYYINASGTSQGITWSEGDWAIWDGSAWIQRSGTIGPDASTTVKGYVELATTAETLAGASGTLVPPVSAVDARALAGDITRPVKPILVSDGATTNRRGLAMFGTHAAGGLPMTFPFEFFVPESNPSNNAHVLNFAPSVSVFSAQSFALFMSFNGHLALYQAGATSGDMRQLAWQPFRTTYSGRWVRGVCVLPGNASTGVKIYLPTGDATSLFAETTNGTPPNWLPTTLDTTVFLNGLNWPSGAFVPHAPGIGAMTETEAMTWIRTGRFPLWWELGTGSAVNKITGNDFSFAGAGNWNPVMSGATLTIDSANAELDVSAPSGSPVAALPGSAMVRGYAPGRRYKLQITLRNIVFLSGGVLRLCEGGTNTILVDNIVADGTYEVEYTAGSSGGFYVMLSTGNGGSYSVHAPTLTDLGPLAKWSPQPPSVVCPDSGDNRVPLLLTPGISAVGERPEHVSVLSQPMTADGFVLADQVITPTGYDLVAGYVQRLNGSSTGTITVKETSSGGTTVATGTLGSDTVALTLSNTLLAGGKKLHVANSSWDSSTIQLRFLFRRTLA